MQNGVKGDNMDIREFADRVRTALLEELGEGHWIEYHEVLKNNGVTMHGLRVRTPDSNAAQEIYLDEFQEACENGMDLAEAVEKILKDCREAVLRQDVDMGFFRSFDQVKDRICYRLVGREANRELLQDVPHVEYLDMAICFFYAFQGEGIGEGRILVRNPMMEAWGTDREELMRLAGENTPRLFPWECIPMDDVIAGIMAGEYIQEETEEDVILDGLQQTPMRVLTNRQMTDGASCMLYPGVLEQEAGEMGCGFYILPSSIHEVILLPDGGEEDTQGLKDMVFRINREQVAPEEVLTDSLYHYNPGKKELEKVL